MRIKIKKDTIADNVKNFFENLNLKLNKIFYKYILKLLRFTKIKNRLIVSFLLLSFIPLTVSSFIGYKKSSDAIETKTEAYTVQIMNEFSKNLRTELAYMESLCEEITMYPEIQQGLINYTGMTKNEKFKVDDSITSRFIEKMRLVAFNSSSEITSINILLNKDIIIGVGQKNYSSKQLQEIVNLSSDNNKYNYRIMKDLNGIFQVSIDKVVKNHVNGVNIGTLMLTFKESYISDICKRLNVDKNSDVFLINSDGVIVSSSDESKIPINKEYSEKLLIETILKNNKEKKYGFSMKINGEKYLVAYHGIENSEWFAVNTIPYKYLQTESQNLMIYIILIGCLCFLFSIPVSFIISYSIAVPVNKLKKVMNEARKGRFDIELVDDNSDEMAEIAARFNDMIFSIKSLIKENINTQKEIVYKLGAVTEARSQETGNHIVRVAYYSKLIAAKYGMPKDEVEIFKMASTLHDIGKISIPDSILLKPGKLTENEFIHMKKHTIVGHEILANSDKQLFKIASAIALEHHEKYDGTGYPNGLKGDSISIYSRIVALADVFDALGTARVYKEKWGMEDIVDYIKAERGKQFDPEIVDIFLENLDEIKVIQEELKD